jgi:hypothetical protein
VISPVLGFHRHVRRCQLQFPSCANLVVSLPKHIDAEDFAPKLNVLRGDLGGWGLSGCKFVTAVLDLGVPCPEDGLEVGQLLLNPAISLGGGRVRSSSGNHSNIAVTAAHR